MKHISKRLGECITRIKSDEFNKATSLLTVKYSFLIFILLLTVSLLVYVVFSLKLGVTIGDGPFIGLFEEQSSHHEASESLFKVLVLVNLIMWFLASIFSYFLARRTLWPIADIHKTHEKFVADVAHELRTPLAIMKSGAETVLRKDRNTDEYKDFIKDSLEETERITALSNDLLTLLKYNQVYEKELESVDFSEIVQQQTKKITDYAETKTISVTTHIQPDVFVHGVSNDLSRLLINLLKNAVDYNKENGSIDISLVQDGGYATLAVSDTGIGMSDTDVLRVCNRFYKADTARIQSNTTVGSGLGLSIVREIVDFHNGTIEINSTVDKGSVFTIVLPCV